MLKRLLLALLLLSATIRVNAADYTDLWWNSAEGGWGVNLVQSDNFMFVTFFIYGPDGTPTWYTADLNWDGVSQYIGGLYLTNGSWFAAPWLPSNSAIAQVGSASFRPSSFNVYQGTLTYTFFDSGITVVKSIERQSLTPITLAGAYVGGQSGSYSSCANSSRNGGYIDRYDLTVTQPSNATATFQFNYTNGLTCTFSGLINQHGQLFEMPSASYQCSDGFNGTATVYEIKATSLGIEGRYFSSNAGGGCREAAQFSAVLQ